MYIPNIAASQPWRTRCYVTSCHPTRTARFGRPDTSLSALLPNIFNWGFAVQMRPTTQWGRWWRSMETSWLTRGRRCLYPYSTVVAFGPTSIWNYIRTPHLAHSLCSLQNLWYTAVIFVNSFNRLVFVIEMQCVTLR